ncbi:respiratory chain complex I subunit 1 family protein [Arenibaculum pallidiluteum]|uniref:respiratory chain complex I subunit 1 family protein n=1 Tax=Arenibaculum pallidiluteum TaxID=2812559 RepID=UPI001A963C86|nr:NADH-quinone oxidoreductase subunit H [Arenibaculum pallidiluteum]
MIVQAIGAAFLQLLQMGLVLVAAPLLTGFVSQVRARLMGRQGPPLLQPFRDLLRLLRKEAVVQDETSWLFTATPFLVFSTLWLAAGLVPTFASGLALAPAADLVALVGLLAVARVLTMLAALDTGAGFGALGAVRQSLVAVLAGPAMLMAIFAVAAAMRSTSLPRMAEFVLSGGVEPRLSLAIALLALTMLALADNARMPVDGPGAGSATIGGATSLEYSGRHLALIEAAGMLRLLIHASLIACIFVPWGMALPGDGALAPVIGLGAFAAKMAGAGVALALTEVLSTRIGIRRLGEYGGWALMAGMLAAIFLSVSLGA